MNWTTSFVDELVKLGQSSDKELSKNIDLILGGMGALSGGIIAGPKNWVTGAGVGSILGISQGLQLKILDEIRKQR